MPMHWWKAAAKILQPSVFAHPFCFFLASVLLCWPLGQPRDPPASSSALSVFFQHKIQYDLLHVVLHLGCVAAAPFCRQLAALLVVVVVMVFVVCCPRLVHVEVVVFVVSASCFLW